MCGCYYNTKTKKWHFCEEAKRLLKEWQSSGEFKKSKPYQKHFEKLKK